MKTFQLTILGSNAAMPAFGRLTSCQAINYNDNYFLIDAGEGAQIRMAEYKIKRNKLRCIFISHLHGDHLFGLPGILTSYNHFNRNTPLHIFGPSGLKKYIDINLEVGGTTLSFDLQVHEIEMDSPTVIWKNHELTVTAFPMKHRIETYGYRFDEVLTQFNINAEKITEFGLSIEEIKAVKSGKDIREGNEKLNYLDLVHTRPAARSYAYCSDTIYDESLVDVLDSVDVLYHETTYTSEFEVEAAERFHTTGKQAAQIAKLSNVQTLVTGHYSSRYRRGEEPYREAKHHFASTLKGYDGFILNILPRESFNGHNW